MKKAFKVLSSFMAAIFMVGTAAAQTTTETVELVLKEEASIEFAPHWYAGINGGVAYTIGEAKTSDLISPAAAISVGYRFSPVFGLRLNGMGWQARGGVVVPTKENFKWNFAQGAVDAVIDFSNWFGGFNPKRVFDAYGFVGGGFVHGFGNDDAVKLYNNGYKFVNYWGKSMNTWVGRAGLGANIRCSDIVSVNIELAANAYDDKFNNKKGSILDWQYTGMVGLTFKFGKGYTEKEAVYEEVKVVQYVEPAPAPAPKPEPAPAPKPEPKKIEPYMCDVFFALDSSKITAEQQTKLNGLIAFMKENPTTKVVCTGYADRDTGTSGYNMLLSKRRAQAVADAIEKAGIDASRVSIDFKGSDVQPFKVDVENRVVISIAK